jgi:hypothetical protein
MSNHPTSFADWQNYPSTLDPIHVSWLKNAKKSKTAFAVADIEGVEIPHKRFLTGVLLFSKKLLSIVLNKMLVYFTKQWWRCNCIYSYSRSWKNYC